MPTSRRRFVAAAGAALLAGCNAADTPPRTATVTPLDVPQSAGEALSAVEAIPVPAVPPAPIVATSHRRSVVDHVETRIETAEAGLSATDGVGVADVEGLGNSEAPLEACRSRLRAYRSDPSRRRFRRLGRSVDDVATIVAHVRTATGDLEVGDLRAAFETARGAFVEVVDGLEYRLASPSIEFLPTASVGEAALDRADDARRSARRDLVDLENPTPAEAADVWRSIASLRLETIDAAGYLGTGLDPTAPPISTAISSRTARHVEALESLDVPRPSDGQPLPSRLGTVLSSVRSHRSELLTAAGQSDTGSISRLDHLLAAVRVRGQLEAFDAAGEATFPLLGDGRGFPVDRLLPEKRAAARSVEALADAAPLARSIGRLADDMVTYGDRLEAGQGTDPVATAHFMYVAARAFVDRSRDRAGWLARALDSPPVE
jgi:hypothetical protein